MKGTLTAKTSITVHAPAAKVWAALTQPELIKQYLMGAKVKTDWKIGSPIIYTGEYQGKPFKEKGVIKRIVAPRLLQATHFSTSSGKPDTPENYALVTYQLEERGGDTVLAVTQDNIADEQGVEGSEQSWHKVLEGLKKTVEAS